MKICSKCGETKPLSEYHRNRRSPDGMRSQCKACIRDYHRAYYAANRENVKGAVRAYREANPETVAERKRTHYAANRKRTSEKRRAWRAANPEKVAEQAERRRHKYPEKRAAHMAVSGAVQRGELRPARDLICSTCGAQAEQYHHHLGYAPEHVLDVVAVCRICHAELHRVTS